MKIKKIFAAIITLYITLCATANAQTASVSRSLRVSAHNADSVRNVWVFFDDATNIDWRVREIENIGAAHRHTIRRLNAASFRTQTSNINTIAAMPNIRAITPVATFVRDNDVESSQTQRRANQDITTAVANSQGYLWHNEMVNIPRAHAYLRVKGLGAPGRGVRMAFFDGGFINNHAAFARMRDSAQVIAAYDFVDSTDSPFDPAPNTDHGLRAGYRHGAQVLGFVAAYLPDQYIGAAYGASFVLARTENVEIEARSEEDNWFAAMEWVIDSVGVDIISSSLGYRDGFDDPEEDWAFWELDSTRTSIAAAIAVQEGVIVVNSVGNEGSATDTSRTLTAPSNVDGVIAVGAVGSNRALASFSSTGPTADGRMKPDVVAPGASVHAISPYPVWANNITTTSGTSFATPIVSSIMALILQAHPNISADSARARLYNSCTFASGQSSPDNRHGHGIPNALHAVMSDNEIFMRVIDRSGLPLAGAKISTPDSTYEISEDGYVLITSAQNIEMPAEYHITFRGESVGSFIANALPYVGEVMIDVDRGSTELTIRPQVVIRRGSVAGRYIFSGLDTDAPAVVSVHTLNGRTVWRENLRINRDGTAEFTWNRRGGRRAASGAYIMTVKHGYNFVSEKLRIID